MYLNDWGIGQMINGSSFQLIGSRSKGEISPFNWNDQNQSDYRDFFFKLTVHFDIVLNQLRAHLKISQTDGN